MGIGRNQLFLKVTRAGVKTCDAGWVEVRRRPRNPYGDSKWIFTMDSLTELVRFLVENTYLCNGGVIRRQIVGLPMGTNPAPVMANLYLYRYESSFVNRLINAGLTGTAKALRNTFRLIDDILSIDNPSFKDHVASPAPDDLAGDEVGGIYPRQLSLNETTISCREVHFLGMEVKDIGGQLVLDLFDKRREFTFKVIRYPHMDSVIPTNIPYGVFIGLLFRRYRICSRLDSFVNQACDVATTLVKQGCAKKRLNRLFGTFLLKLSPLRWKTPIWKIYRRFTRGVGN